ncbi:MAG: hypothetical protein L3J57_12135 [Desulfuromusa sp.]|nr:hypothetical protein [Desulfuromusa sp.]
MKRKIILTTIFLALTVASPVIAQQTQHATKSDPTTTQMNMEKLNSSMMQAQEIRQKMGTTTNKTERMKLMGKHMQMMKKMMSGMNMMGQGNMMDSKDISKMSMPDRMSMMEKKMSMMNNMMKRGGMMNCMKPNSTTNSAQTLEKKIQIMQEMMNGILTQQEMLMKNSQ